MRAYFVGADVFAESSAGVIDLTDVAATDIVWGSWTSIASANFAAQFQTQTVFGEFTRLGANDGAVMFVDASGAEALDGLYVDVIRYGVM